MLKIIESRPADNTKIYQLHMAAFGESEGPEVSKLTMDLLDDETAVPRLSLIALKGDELVGHALFTAVKLHQTTDAAISILAPLAVSESCQKSGVGTELIADGLSVLKDRGVAVVLVLGDPNYYGRAGFKAGHKLLPPHPLEYPEAWMALELEEGALNVLSGEVECALSLNAPEYW